MKTYRDLSSILLYIGNADGSISLNDHDPSAISIAHARAPTVILGEEGFGVAHEQHFGILLGSIDLHAQETKRGFFLSAQFRQGGGDDDDDDDDALSIIPFPKHS